MHNNIKKIHTTSPMQTQFNFTDNSHTPASLSKSSNQLVEINSEMFKVIVNAEFQKKVTYLHNSYPRVEWGGYLFYTTNQSETISNLVITLVDFYPLDLGNGTFTSYTQTPEFATFIADNPQYMNYNMGIIHSHHYMSAFHSGTDIDTLKTQTTLFHNLLSVIVNVEREWDVKLAKREVLEYKQFKRNAYNYSNALVQLQTADEIITKELIYVYKGEYEYETWEDVPAEFKAVADKLKRSIAHDTDFYGNLKTQPSYTRQHAVNTQNYLTQPRSFNDLNKAANNYIQNPDSMSAATTLNSTAINGIYDAEHYIKLKSFTDKFPIEINSASMKLLIQIISMEDASLKTINLNEKELFENWEKVLYAIINKNKGRFSVVKSLQEYIDYTLDCFYKDIVEKKIVISDTNMMQFSDDLEWIITACPEREHNNIVMDAVELIYNSISEYIDIVLSEEELEKSETNNY